MRLFVAVVLSDENQQRLRVPVDRLVRAHANVLRAIPTDTAHLTLAFLADVREEDIESVASAVGEAAHGLRPFDIVLSAPRVLRSRRDPRLVMLPVTQGGEVVAHIAGAVHRALARQVPSLEVPPFKAAHVTLARFRKQAAPRDGQAVEIGLAASDLAEITLRESVGAIRLAKSTLLPAGPQYEVVATSSLAG